MKKIKNYDGYKFGKITVIKDVGKKFYYYDNKPPTVLREVLCSCDCGNTKVILLRSLVSGNTKSCGCLMALVGKKNRKYDFNTQYDGQDVFKRDTYKIWAMMKGRCTNPNSKVYKWYGGRGIIFDPKWNTFSGFLEDMGYKPFDDYSLDRIDSDKNYCKENCRWIPRKDQSKNTRKTKKVMYKNELITLLELVERTNSKYETVYNRIFKYGWEPEKAVNPSINKRIKK